MNKLKILTILLIMIGLSGCEQSATGFSLPAGDVAKGEQVFLSMQCLSCHEVEGYERPEGTEDTLSVSLGGKVQSLKTYPELVTSVINPSHRLAKGYDTTKIQVEGESVMPVFNDVLTVTDLVNLITFLESKYELEPYSQTKYIMYH
ncbi:c-type cytochrome [Photobacterium sp. SDRW27]|uniref:c-type cytochrome n=1 Tax=Photobacterium obscurum TaxID=2829490 RepID=UPI002244D3D0|nr:c-type cytochrome [Photobacterium obscurum]MCW8329722.1 c-type cytochrome [Photobacterium obscurum]